MAIAKTCQDTTLHSDGTLFGHLEDDPEHPVIGATHAFVYKPNNPQQWDDLGLLRTKLRRSLANDLVREV